MAAESSKKTKGRQKIEMKKIENEDDKLITFSKRRSGIYKKASELVTLTGAELAFVVYSPAGKPFSFAHPSMDAVANRFLGREADLQATDTTHPLVEAHRLMRIEELNQQHNEMLRQLDVEKDQGKQLKQKIRSVVERKGWWDTPIDQLNVQQLIEMESALKNTQMNLINKLRERSGEVAGGASSSAAAQRPPQMMINPFSLNPNQTNPPIFLPDYGYGPNQMQ